MNFLKALKTFQFQYGTIKSDDVYIVEFKDIAFQFQYGTIKSNRKL